ncbi:unnamed protein product, partial [Didymodactylos carnosus]
TQETTNSNTLPTTSAPCQDGAVHRLPEASLLDLFIRTQMNERGIITFNRPRTRFRLVEPVSQSDEFDSWTFDHFHQIFDLWLTPDYLKKEHFPARWKLGKDTLINYVIADQFTVGNDDDNTSRRNERPSTKSLENFVRDICELEDNGMYEEWLDALTLDESITTYAHLANLNQKEWDRIGELPMNALKTIKSYVDREKQTAENRKVKIKDDKQGEDQIDKSSYSKSELRANLHMIKLYFIRQLENKKGIEQIPQLEKYCVEEAFKEMRAEGYEDDGLFDEMELFFQPLTVTDEELKINKDQLEKLNKEQHKRKKALDDRIKQLREKIEAITNELKELGDKVDELKEKRRGEFELNKKEMEKPENQSYQTKTKLDKSWSDKNDEFTVEINKFQTKITEKERELKKLEAKKVDKENLLKIIDNSLRADQTKIDKKLVKAHRGFIMYGPPGTGKSAIMSKLAKKIGIAMLGPPLAAGELERPLVGQSEAVILDLCMRGNRLPHLMCCVSIDEIDSLAPKRDEDSSEGKVAKISVLLSVIEGIKDVPNLMFFSATNRLHMMDEAFLRRMSGKFFVGRPSSEARKRILSEIPKIILQPDVREKLATATTNFSGAALKALNGAITVHYISQRRSKPDYDINKEDALILADRTARQFQLFLGLDTLPRLLLRNLQDLRLLQQAQPQPQQRTTKILSVSDPAEGFHLQENSLFTGKIIISLQEKCVRIETIETSRKGHHKKYVYEDQLRETEQNLQQLLERITSYGNDRNVQLLQLIDLNLLSSKGAYDEKKVFETLKERYDECMEYKRSMIVYDLDSLIGVNKSESESSMGTSTSSSVVNQSIYIYVTSRFREAKIEVNNADKRLKIERWAIAVVRDPFLLKKFAVDVEFTSTEEQQKEEEDERRKSKEQIKCVKCRDFYIETENKMGSCTYHDGFVYDNSSYELKQYRQNEAIEELNHDEFKVMTADSTETTQKDEVERKKTRFKYICCNTTVQAGTTAGGCKKGKHGLEGSEGKRKKGTGKVLDEETVKKWELECLNNQEYNELRTQLLKQRQQGT